MTPANRRLLVLGWGCLGVLLAAADLTALATLIPTMVVDLRVPMPGGLDDVAWVVHAYLIGNILALPITGRLADRLNRRIVYTSCLLVFVVGSVGSALAPTLWTLVAARTVQAVGAGAMVPITMTIATDLLPRARWALAFGVIAAVDTVGWAIGPLYGALFVGTVGWRWLFWINVPLGLLALIGGWSALREHSSIPNRRPIDWLGAVLLTAGLTTLNIGLSRLGGAVASGISFDFGPAAPPWRAALPWLTVGLALLFLFGRTQLTRVAPLIDVRWLARPSVRTASILNVLFGAMLMTAVVNVPLFVNAAMATDQGAPEVVARATALRSGLLLMALTGIMAAGAPVGGILATRLGTRAVVSAGAASALAGFWMMRAWLPATELLVMCGHLALVGIGFGLMLAPLGTVIVDTAAPDERGLASSLVLLLRLSGMSLGLSLLTAWSLDRFRRLSAAEPITSLTAARVQQIITEVLATTFAIAAGLALVALILGLTQPRRTS